MAVAIDAKSNWIASQNGVTSYTDASFTVGSGSNRVLVVALACESVAGSLPTPTVNWDSTGTNQSMTLISTMSDTGRTTRDLRILLYGLVAPTSGNKTLSVASLNANTDSFVSYISYTGADQTGGTTTFKNAVTNNSGSGTSAAATITTNVNDAALCVFGGNNGTPTVDNVAWAAAALLTSATDFWISNYKIAVGASSVLTMTQTSAKFNFNGLAISQSVPFVAPESSSIGRKVVIIGAI